MLTDESEGKGEERQGWGRQSCCLPELQSWKSRAPSKWKKQFAKVATRRTEHNGACHSPFTSTL